MVVILKKITRIFEKKQKDIDENGRSSSKKIVELDYWQSIFGNDPTIEMADSVFDNISDEEIEHAIESTTQFIRSNQEEILKNMLTVLLRRYNVWREKYKDDYGDEDSYLSVMPAVNAPEDLIGLLELRSIVVSRECVQGAYPYGVRFGCTWEDEHGLGFMMYKTKVLNIGDSIYTPVWGEYEEAYMIMIHDAFPENI